MADTDAPIDPDRILEQQFTMVRRGLDPLEVQRFLLQLANQIRAGRDRESELRQRVEEAEQRTAPIDQLDPSQLMKLLGEETARVLEAAQSAAADIKAKAEENVARLLREARDEAQKMREDADTVLSRRTAEAEEVAAGIRAEAAGVLDEARAEAAELVEAGRQEGREMVGEAQKVRQRMLDDLARRRKQLRQQIEQLQAGRDRLLAAYDVVRQTLDVATDELHVALPEAKLAAETAALKASEDDHDTFVGEESAEAEAPADAAATEPDAAPAEAEAALEPEPEPEPEPAGPTTATGETGAEAPSAAEPEAAAEAEQAEEAPAEEPTAEEAVAVEPAPAEPEPVEPEPVEVEPLEVEAIEAIEADVEVETVEAVEPEVAGVELEATAAEGDEDDEEARAPDPVEGRHSSSVRVVRASGDKAADVFARLRAEAPEDEHGETEPGAGATATAVVEVTEIAEVVEVIDGDVDEEELDEGPLDPAEELVVRRDAATAQLERNLARRLKRELSDEQNELLASLAAAKGAAKASDVLPAPEAHVERYESIALPTLATAATAGADLVSTVAGPPATRTTVADLAAELAADVVAPLRERLERSFAESDGDPDEVAQRIRSCYREWKGQRVDQIATHAVVAACNRGLLDRLPEGTLVRWVVADGDHPSPDCEDNALAGAVPRGEAFPTGHTSPPLHATCRCLVVPADL